MPSVLRHAPYFELLEALGQPGCAICRLGTRSVARYLDSLSYENVNDIDLRATIREAIGLCNHHAWQFVNDTRELLGTAIIYRDLIRTLQRRAREGSIQSALTARGGCVACSARRTAIRDFAELLMTSWSDLAVRQAVASSEGLCWNHLMAALSAGRSAARRRDLIEAQRAAWDRRIARALRQGKPLLVLEALASAPGMTGVQVSPIQTDPAIGGKADTVEDAPAAPPGHCPVCAAVADWLNRRREDDAVGLVCSVHAWLPVLQPSTADLGFLEGRLRDLDRRLVSLIESDSDGPVLLRWTRRYRRWRGWSTETVADAGCPVCREQSHYELAMISRTEPATLCVPHLRLAALHRSDVEATVLRTRQTWHEVEMQLAEYIRKHDYRFRHESIGDEKGSPGWAVELVTGLEGVR